MQLLFTRGVQTLAIIGHTLEITSERFVKPFEVFKSLYRGFYFLNLSLGLVKIQRQFYNEGGLGNSATR
jgi:hypothetical protein